MQNKMDLRRQHRIIYQTKIRMRAPGRDDSVVVRVQNLSARGMFVTATDLPGTELPEAGTEVQCRLTLGGERRTIRGRVAWVRPASASAPLKSPGAGIEFIELDQRDSELLTRLVEPLDERREPVDVWFEGMAAPIRCMAVVVGDSIRLETKLPFMRLHSEVKVAFTQHASAETREGILDGVTLEPSVEDGVPFLRVAVTVPPADSARGTIEAGTPAVERRTDVPLASTLVDPSVARPGAGAAPAELTPSVATPPPGPTAVAAAPRPRRFGLAFLGVLVGAMLAAGVAWMAWPRFPPQGPITAGAEPAPPVPVPTAPVVPAAATTTVAPTPDPATTESAALAGARDEAKAAAPGPEVPPLAEGAEGAGDDTGPAGGDRGVSLEARADGRVVVEIALAGSSAGAQEVRYNEPPGIGIVLPKGRPTGGFGSLFAGKPEGVGAVRVVARKRGAGSLVRVLYEGKTVAGKLGVGDDGVRIILSKR